MLSLSFFIWNMGTIMLPLLAVLGTYWAFPNCQLVAKLCGYVSV
jgi:hypothetical protein